MTEKQFQAAQHDKTRETYIEVDAIRAFCEDLMYPLYHLGFETYQQTVSQGNGNSPNEQIPFQYSLHVEHCEDILEHKAFLGEAGVDPRRALAERLVRDIPLHVTTLAYNMSFEKEVLRKLAELFEDLREHLLNIHDNMKDLMTPFQKKYYVTPLIQESHAIHYIVPALVPEFEKIYQEIEDSQNGAEVINTYASLHVKSLEEQERVKKQLLAHGELDTLAMVKVLDKLREVSYS